MPLLCSFCDEKWVHVRGRGPQTLGSNTMLRSCPVGAKNRGPALCYRILLFDLDFESSQQRYYGRSQLHGEQLTSRDARRTTLEARSSSFRKTTMIQKQIPNRYLSRAAKRSSFKEMSWIVSNRLYQAFLCTRSLVFLVQNANYSLAEAEYDQSTINSFQF